MGSRGEYIIVETQLILLIMAIRHNVIKNAVEVIDDSPSGKQINGCITKNNLLSLKNNKTRGSLSKLNKLRSPVDNKLKFENIESYHRPFMRNSKLIRSATRSYSLRSFALQSGTKNIIWWAFVSTVIASIFGQLSNVAIATNDVLSKDGFASDSQGNDVKDFIHVPSFETDEEDYSDYTNDGTTSETGDYGETICFYNESDDDDITCLPEIDDHDGVEKRANYLFRSKKGSYLFRSRRAPSYLFRSKKAPSYLFRSRRSPDEMLRDRKAQGYLFRSRRAPSYLFRSRKAPSYLFRSRRAPSYLFRSKKSDGKQSRSYFFRSRKAPGGYLFRSRRGQGYLFRSRREEHPANNVKSDKDPSIATRAGYLFRTRKSDPGNLRDEENLSQIIQGSQNHMNRQLRSRSYLFRSKKSPSYQLDDNDSSNIDVATRGAYLFRT